MLEERLEYIERTKEDGHISASMEALEVLEAISRALQIGSGLYAMRSMVISDGTMRAPCVGRRRRLRLRTPGQSTKQRRALI